MIRTALIAVLLVLNTQSLFAQLFHRKENQKQLLILSPGVSYQGQYFGEINLMLSRLEEGGPCVPPIVTGPRLGVEANFDSKHHVYAPKFGYELSVMLFSVRANTVAYLDQGKTDLRFLPEIGLSLLGGVNLMYGRNISLTDFHTNVITQNKISLTINLDFDLWNTF